MIAKLIVAAMCLLSAEAINITNKSCTGIETQASLTPQQIIATHSAEAIWEKLDHNKDGKLTVPELTQVINSYMGSMGITLNQFDIKNFVDIFHLSDANKDGKVTEAEAMEWLNKYKSW